MHSLFSCVDMSFWKDIGYVHCWCLFRYVPRGMTLRFPCFRSRECLIECNAYVCIMSQQNLKTCFCGLYNADLHTVLMLSHQKCTENCRSVHICAVFALTEHLFSDEVLSYFSVHRLMLLTLINIMIIIMIRHKAYYKTFFSLLELSCSHSLPSGKCLAV